jgi:hypothetical protein
MATSDRELPNMLRLQHDTTRPHLALALILAGACFATGAASALAASSFDGTYRGTQKTIRTNNSSDCTRIDQENVALTVQDNHFVRHWGVITFDVTIAADGTFSSNEVTGAQRKLRAAQMTGKITGNNLEADIGTDLCAGHLSLKK